MHAHIWQERKRSPDVEEQFYIPVSIMWEEQGAEETYPGADPWLLLRCSESWQYDGPGATRTSQCPPKRLPGTWQGKQLEWLESPSSSHWQHFQHCKSLPTWTCPVNASMWRAQKQGEALPDFPRSTGVEYGSGTSVTFVFTTSNPNTMQASTLNERYGQ